VRKQWSPTVAVGPLSLEIPRGEILVCSALRQW